jgi:hypothetical protein
MSRPPIPPFTAVGNGKAVSMSGVLSGGPLGGSIVVIPIHREPRLGNTVDDGSASGFVVTKRSKSAFRSTSSRQ